MSLKNLFLVLLATIFSWGCSLFRTIEFETSDGLAVEQLGYEIEFDEESKKIFIKNNENTLAMTLNRRISKFNGTKVWFYFPIKADQHGDLRISRVDFEKIITPLFAPKNIAAKKFKRIVIDAGHGGDDAGAIGAKYKEKDLNLSLALKTKKALDSKGFEVILTRDNDVFLTLDERVDFTEKKEADLFISIHHNAAAGVKAAHGIETYSLTFANNAGTHDSGKNATTTHERKGNRFDHENIILNYLVQSSVINATKAFDRGVKFARYKVLCLAPCPAILFEAGFVSNPKEEEQINSEERQNKTASAIAEAVAKFAELMQ